MDDFDALMARLDPAMVVVTTAADGERSGCLVGFHGQAGIDPPRYAVWISRANHTFGVVTRARHLAVHALTAADHDAAEHFGGTTGDRTDPFAAWTTTDGPDGVPLVDRLPTRFVGRIVDVVDTGGDHLLAVVEPLTVELGPDGPPLRLAACTDITAGHPAG